MRDRVENLRVKEIELPIPELLERELNVPKEIDSLIISHRDQLARAIRASQPPARFQVIAGQCSVHDIEETIELGHQICSMQKMYPNVDFLMRVCGEKPRSNGGCWKGIINDPHLDGSCDIEAGIRKILRLMFELSKLGIPIATEFLDPDIATYIAGFVTLGWIGARSSADQRHRELGSGLSMPVGFKNGTGGEVEQAINAVKFARNENTFLSLSFSTGKAAVIKTKGNQDGFVILRGGTIAGVSVPNYDPMNVRLVGHQLSPMRMAIDCSHDNSGKDHTKQGEVFRKVVDYHKQGLPVFGAMIEMNLKPGKQAWKEGMIPIHGISVTDGCIGVEEGHELFAWANNVLA